MVRTRATIVSILTPTKEDAPESIVGALARWGVVMTHCGIDHRRKSLPTTKVRQLGQHG